MSRTISRCLLYLFVALFAAPFSAYGADKTAPASLNIQMATQQVGDALRAEAAGNNDRRAELLTTAYRLAPQLARANWHLGRLLVADKWLSFDQAAAQAAKDPQLTEYRQLRDEADGNWKLTRGLARWCLKNDLPERARLHYGQLLACRDIDADTLKEAIQRLDLLYVNGTWMTRDEFQAQQAKVKAANEAITKFRPKLKKLQQTMDVGDFAVRERVRKEIAQIDNPQCIPALETFLSDGGLYFQETAAEHLAGFPDYSATEALVRFAVLSDYVGARDKAIAALKSRPLHEYVPLLLSGLAAPIQSQYEVKTLPNGAVTYVHVFTRETPQQKLVNITYDQVAPSFVPRQFQLPNGTRGILVVFFDDNVWARQTEFAQQALLRAQERDIAATAATKSIAATNARVFQALTRATQQQLPENPQAWWQWWQDYNQYHWPQQTSVYYATSYSQYRTPPPVQVVRGHSCFLAGTLVQTDLGPAIIESIRPGDRVLSQDQDTGELTFKLVLRTTIRPPAKMVRIQCGRDSVTTTLGHPFWVAGHGWKMAKELQTGDLLHSLSGAVPIDKVEPAGEDKAYNLVVEDFNTYFVGPQKLLVHDNEFRKPTLATMPGLTQPLPTAAVTRLK